MTLLLTLTIASVSVLMTGLILKIPDKSRGEKVTFTMIWSVVWWIIIVVLICVITGKAIEGRYYNKVLRLNGIKANWNSDTFKKDGKVFKVKTIESKKDTAIEIPQQKIDTIIIFKEVQKGN